MIKELNLLDNEGIKIKTYRSSELIVNPDERLAYDFLAWGPDSIWLDNTFGPSLTGLAKVDTKTFLVTRYDLASLQTGPEYTINVYKEKIAFSNYPALFDADGAKEYLKSGAKVNLIVYDLKNKTQQQIAISITKRFEPRWLDANTLEYNNPNSEGRLTQKVN